MGYSEALEKTLALSRRIERQFVTRDAVDRVLAKQWATHFPDSEDPSGEITDRMMISGHVAKFALDHGDVFYWAPDICRLIGATAETMPDWTLTPERLPSASGVFWFSAEFAATPRLQRALLANNSSADAALVGICWTTKYGYLGYPLNTALLGHPAGTTEAIALTPIHAGDNGPYPSIPDYWIFGYGYQETARRQGDVDAGGTLVGHIRLFACMLAFIQQRILVAPAHRVERHAVKRLERGGWTHEPLVRVVELRRKASQAKASDDPKAVAWTHQWVVSGHWRQQPYPSLGIVQPRWIMPHVQGPAHLPLKPPRAKVFAVVR